MQRLDYCCRVRQELLDALQHHPVACPKTHALTRVHFSGDGCAALHHELGQLPEGGVLGTVMRSVTAFSTSVSEMLLDNPLMHYTF